MARQRLTLCEEDDEKVAVIMRTIYDKAESARDDARSAADTQTAIRHIAVAHALEWAGSLLGGGTGG